MAPPVFLAAAAGAYGARIGATFWDQILIPILTRTTGPSTLSPAQKRDLIESIMGTQNVPVFGNIRDFMVGQSYRDPADFVTDTTALFGAALGSATLLGRFVIAGGVKTVAASLSTLAALIPAYLATDKATLSRNAAELLLTNQAFADDLTDTSREAAEVGIAFGDLLVRPTPQNAGNLVTQSVEALASVATAMFTWFQDLTGAPPPPHTPPPPLELPPSPPPPRGLAERKGKTGPRERGRPRLTDPLPRPARGGRVPLPSDLGPSPIELIGELAEFVFPDKPFTLRERILEGISLSRRALGPGITDLKRIIAALKGAPP